VSDFGTGTGIWAIEFADDFPTALVIGTDLSPIHPRSVPPNVEFYIDDVESEWVETETSDGGYDFIHGHCMAGSIKDWPQLYRQAIQCLKPGAWIEIQEFETWTYSDDYPDLDPVPHLKHFQDEVNKASRVFGRNLNIAREHKQYLVDAGFVDVNEEIYKVSFHLLFEHFLTTLGPNRHLATGPETQTAR
jgi:trans-aconitate methyltransferase